MIIEEEKLNSKFVSQVDCVIVKDLDLPITCPNQNMALWNMHPQVFLSVKETGEAICPYCSTKYVYKKSED